MLSLRKVLTALLIGSALCLAVGSYFLYVYSLVPVFLTEATIGAVIVLCILSYYVARGVKIAINIATILGIVAPIMSISTPAHVGVLEQLVNGGDLLISGLAFLQLLGFYVFPIAFVILRIVLRSKL